MDLLEHGVLRRDCHRAASSCSRHLSAAGSSSTAAEASNLEGDLHKNPRCRASRRSGPRLTLDLTGSRLDTLNVTGAASMALSEQWLRLAPKPRPLGKQQKWHVFLSYRSV